MSDTNTSTTGAKTRPSLKYKRVLLKISGEALMGDSRFGIDLEACQRMALEIAKGVSAGAEMCLVIGGGNIFRGMTGAAQGMDRAAADNLGMLATVMNALAMQSALEGVGIETRVQSAVPMTTICEPFIRRRAMRHMEKGRIVIFAAGTGNPFFTTDTGAALRAAEMGCDAMFKGTQVDGVYSADPHKFPDAVRYNHLGYLDVISQDLKVMDATAVSMMREADIPIVVFSIHNANALLQVLRGEGLCTVISSRK